MKILRITQILGLASLMLLFVQCDDEIYLPDQATAAKSSKAVKAPSEETAGNNLSYPVLWADDYGKELRGGDAMGLIELNGEWWYVWGEDPIDPNYPVYSCQPSPNNSELCLDGSTPGDGVSEVYKAFVQKDVNNTWQAFNATPIGPVNVDWIDWGDDLESVNWSLNSMVRAEVVLFEGLEGLDYIDKTLPPNPQFPMRHVSGWGSNEVHGFQVQKQNGEPAYEMVTGDMATVYSHNARFTIQKMNVENLDNLDGKLQWVKKVGWFGTEGNEDIINPAIFNKPVYEAGDGPGYYNAEINVKGKVIYGYTWKVRNLNEGEGYYRLTFSLDDYGTVELNTFFDEFTEIIVAEDDDDDGEEGEDGDGNDAVRGGIGYIDVANNLTYMDILITPKNSGGGKGGGNGGSGAGNGGGNGGNTGNGVPGGGKGGRN